MQTAVETINSYSKKLKVEIDSSDLTPIQQKIIKSYQRSAKIPGFRPGKAPLNMVQKKYKDEIQQSILEEALQKFYGMALEEAKVNPVSQGKITDFHFHDVASGMQLEIEVEVEPEVELKKYKGLQVEKDVVEVTDEMVDDSLERMREQFATVKEVEEAKEDHFVYFTAQELDKTGVPILGHKYENLQVQIGSGKFDPEIEAQLAGIRKDEKRVVKKEMPPAPDDKEQKPQVSSLQIHALKIEEKEFPELNDDFVKNLNDENLNTLEDLRQRIRENLKHELEHRSEHAFEHRIIDELLRENPSEVPPTMVDNYLDEMVRDIKEQSKNQKIDEESVRKEYRASAIHNLRWHFLKKKIIEKEGIEVSDEEARKMIDDSTLDEKAKKQARTNQHYLNHLKEDLVERKVLDLLEEHAEITEVFPFRQTGSEKDKKSKKSKTKTKKE